MISYYFTWLIYPYHYLKKRYWKSDTGMVLTLGGMITYWNTFQLVRTILLINTTRRYLSKSYLKSLRLEYNRQQKLGYILYKLVPGLLHYPSVVDTMWIKTTASKVSVGYLKQIRFGQSQYLFAATYPFRYTFISVVLMCLIPFQDPTKRTTATLWTS